jgi:DNA-binding response OmpR family regulator
MNDVHILLVEDDTRLQEMLSSHFGKLGWTSTCASTIKQATEFIQIEKFTLIVLDRNLPDADGLDFCKSLRQSKSNTPILMLTAYTDEIDLVVGLESGADDYVGKPFKLAELIARIGALLRRSSNESQQEDSLRVFDGLSINISRREIQVNNQLRELTAKEFDLLVFLSKKPGQVFTRSQILAGVWDSNQMNYEQSINTIVKRLRKKIEKEPSEPRYLKTIRGVGYQFCGS